MTQAPDQPITIQLRRYVVREGKLDDYVSWWRSRIRSLRESAGFTVQFCLADYENNQFVWAVSVPGDIEAFEAVERRYIDSPARHEAFESLGDWVSSTTVEFVDDVLAPEVSQ